MTTKLYMAAHYAMVRQDFESDGCRCIVVMHSLGAFATLAAAESLVAKLNEEALRELMFGEQVETVEELVEIVGQEQVDEARQMYFVQEVELNEDEVSRQERREKDLHGQPPAIEGNTYCRLCGPGERVNLDDLPDDFTIPAEVHTDDCHIRVVFDAAKWFEQALPEQIVALAQIGWANNREADSVALELEDEPGFGLLRHLFAYCRSALQTGFEVHVSRQAALAWLKANNAELYRQLATAGD